MKIINTIPGEGKTQEKFLEAANQLHIKLLEEVSHIEFHGAMISEDTGLTVSYIWVVDSTFDLQGILEDYNLDFGHPVTYSKLTDIMVIS